MLARAFSNGTHVSTTTLTANATWTLAGSPYILDGNVTVAATATLTIEPGVVIKLNGTSRSMIVIGTLVAEGTATNRITFTSLQDDSVGGDSGGDGLTIGARGQWWDLRLQSSSTTTRLKFVDVRFGGYGGPAVRINGGCGAVTIEDSKIATNLRPGLKLGATAGCVPSATIKRTEIADNGGYGIELVDGSLTLDDDSVIRDNEADGVRFALSGGFSGARSLFRDSDITGNDGAGIYFLVAEGQPDSVFPTGVANNIYDNAGKELGEGSASSRRTLDWTGNYFGSSVRFLHNNADQCAPGDLGRLRYAESAGENPDGPMVHRSRPWKATSIQG